MGSKVPQLLRKIGVRVFKVDPRVPADAALDALNEVDLGKPKFDSLQKLRDVCCVFLPHTFWPEPPGLLGPKVLDGLWPTAIEYLSCKSISRFVEHGLQNRKFFIFCQLQGFLLRGMVQQPCWL